MITWPFSHCKALSVGVSIERSRILAELECYAWVNLFTHLHVWQWMGFQDDATCNVNVDSLRKQTCFLRYLDLLPSDSLVLQSGANSCCILVDHVDIRVLVFCGRLDWSIMDNKVWSLRRINMSRFRWKIFGNSQTLAIFHKRKLEAWWFQISNVIKVPSLELWPVDLIFSPVLTLK